VGFADALRENRDTLIRGVTLLVGGLALILVGTLIGEASGKLAMIAAGTLAVGGVTVAFLGFFLYLLPPLLPPK